MKISVVTISFNQAEFLERTIQSVLGQEGAEFEYIIADPGSTDGSRDIIEKYRDKFSAIIFERDAGPADGLNKGFARATGDIFYYLNSDDTVEPGAFATALRAFERDPELDVLCAHAWIVDENDRRLRRVWSDSYSALRQAYGAAVQIQPSTYIRADKFRKVGGFNVENRCVWDNELFVDLCLSGAKVKILDAFLSNFRLHSQSITGGNVNDSLLIACQQRAFRKIMGREPAPRDRYFAYTWKLYRQFRNPVAFFERLSRGPVFRRMAR